MNALDYKIELAQSKITGFQNMGRLGRDQLAAWQRRLVGLQADRDARIKLKVASPLRSAKAQDDVDGLAVFDAVRQPQLF
jgi:hypothetical protein